MTRLATLIGIVTLTAGLVAADSGDAQARCTWDFSTHSLQEDPNIAFHEGFGEFAGIEALADLWPARFRPRAWSRTHWDRFETLGQVQRYDRAVTSALRYFTQEHRGVDWIDSLRVFRANSARGWRTRAFSAARSARVAEQTSRTRSISATRAGSAAASNSPGQSARCTLSSPVNPR